MTEATSYVSGYEIKGVLYLNADQLQIALLKGGHEQAAKVVEDAAKGVREVMRR